MSSAPRIAKEMQNVGSGRVGKDDTPIAAPRWPGVGSDEGDSPDGGTPSTLSQTLADAEETDDVMAGSPTPAPVGVTERLAAASARRPRRTLTVWGIVVVVALVLVATCLKGLTSSAHVVGTTESSQAKALYAQVVGGAVHRTPTDVIVVSSKNATAGESTFHAFVARLLVPVRNSPGVTSVSTDLSPGSPYISSDHHAVLIGLRAASDGDIKPVVKAVQAANGRDGFSVAVTGSHTVGNDFTTQSTKDLQHGELDFGLPIALVILVLVFGAVVAGLMPVLMALLSIVVGLGIAALISREFSLSIFIVNMMTGMGLALGIDYSLFVISRFREERGRGLDKEAAIRMAGATASRAVLFSGSTFVVALLGMFLVPTNILRSLAAGAVIVGIVSVAAALTLLPAMLSLIGDRVNSLRLPVVGKNLGRTDASEARMWRAVIGRVMRHPAVYLVLAGGVMIAAAAPVVGLHIGQSGVNTLPAEPALQAGLPGGAALLPEPGPVPRRRRGGGSSAAGESRSLQARGRLVP